jgi:hypothetical protein
MNIYIEIRYRNRYIPMSESKFRCRNRNSDSETRMEIPSSKSKPQSKFRFLHRNLDEIRIKFRRNFDFAESKTGLSWTL